MGRRGVGAWGKAGTAKTIWETEVPVQAGKKVRGPQTEMCAVVPLREDTG
jgi:hypothetical protein